MAVPTTPEATLEGNPSFHNSHVKPIIPETTIQECGPLSNLTITPEFNTIDNYINLKLSWNEIDNNSTVSIDIIKHPNSTKDCYPEMHIFNHPLLVRLLKKPTTN